MNISKEVSLDELAAIADDFNGAQIKAVCTEAGMFAIREERTTVNLKDFKEAIKKVRESGTEGSVLSLHKGPARKEGYSMFA